MEKRYNTKLCMTLKKIYIMQADIHPDYKKISVQCNCGNAFETGMSYKKSDQLKVEICSQCHPYYTGNEKIVDTEGRVESYYSKYGKKQEAQATKTDEK